MGLVPYDEGYPIGWNATNTPEHTIDSMKYYDLYFSYGSNRFTIIGKDIAAFITEVSKGKEINAIRDLLKDSFSTIPTEDHGEWIQQFGSSIYKIPALIRFELAVALLDCIDLISDFDERGREGQRYRIVDVCAQLFEGVDDIKMDSFVSSLRVFIGYSHLRYIERMLQRMRAYKKRERVISCHAIEVIKEWMMGLANEIIEKPINLYEAPNYVHGNIMGLAYSLQKDSFHQGVLKDYLNEILRAEDIYRLLWDCTRHLVPDVSSADTAHRYQISEDTMELLGVTNDLIDQMISGYAPQSEDEGFVLKVYRARIESEDNEQEGYVETMDAKSLQL